MASKHLLMLFAALALALAAPATGAVLRFTVPAGGGIANLTDSSFDPQFLTGPTVVTVNRGQLLGGQWLINGELAKLWWDPSGGGLDENDEPIPALTGNEYTYSPECTVAAGSPCAQDLGLSGALVGNSLRFDFTPPADSYDCTPVFTGDTGDCAFSYSFASVDFDLYASVSDGPVTFTLSAPVPEPASWLLLLTGFGLTGAMLRRRVGMAGLQ